MDIKSFRMIVNVWTYKKYVPVRFLDFHHPAQKSIKAERTLYSIPAK